MAKLFNIDAWLNSGRYLPPVLREFDDQREVFRAIDQVVIKNPENFIRHPSWIEAHAYVIDTFLWFMAKRGYTLQKTRLKAEFRSLEDDVAACNRERESAQTAALLTIMQGKK